MATLLKRNAHLLSPIDIDIDIYIIFLFILLYYLLF